MAANGTVESSDRTLGRNPPGDGQEVKRQLGGEPDKQGKDGDTLKGRNGGNGPIFGGMGHGGGKTAQLGGFGSSETGSMTHFGGKTKRRRNRQKNKNSRKNKGGERGNSGGKNVDLNDNEDVMTENHENFGEGVSGHNNVSHKDGIKDKDAIAQSVKNQGIQVNQVKAEREVTQGGDKISTSGENSRLKPEFKVPPPPTIGNKQDGILSPRKQALKRYHSNDDRVADQTFISQAKENLKNKNSGASLSDASELKLEHTLLTKHNLNMDGKITLFEFASSKILMFDEQLQPNGETKSLSGRLLGHGKFEIFQLHNGDVSYLSCGPSFVYPLLPKLKILRTGFNQFILPLVNPERYWKIFINTEELHVISNLIQSLERVVKYRNLYFGADKGIITTTEQTGTGTGVSPLKFKAGHSPKSLHSYTNRPQHGFKLQTPHHGLVMPNGTVNDFERFNAAGRHFSVISNDIPESPPSAPLSPNSTNGAILPLDLSYSSKDIKSSGVQLLDDKTIDANLGQNMAHLNLNHIPEFSDPAIVLTHANTAEKDAFDSDSHKISKLHQPKPVKGEEMLLKHSNPFQDSRKKISSKIAENKSESSMDSLLDEYEENISTTKSINFNTSRPQSRAMSRTSSFVQPQIHYKRSIHLHNFIDENPGSSDYNHASETGNDVPFPSASLSEYNKMRKGASCYARSRRSSRSDLYTSESNWMEPNLATDRAHGRGSSVRYANSVSGNHIYQRSNINTDIKQIYRSVTQKNLHQYSGGGLPYEESKSGQSYKSTASLKNHNPIRLSHSFSNNLNSKDKFNGSFSSSRTGYESNGRNQRPRDASLSRSVSFRRDLDEPKKSDVAVKLNSSEVYKMISKNKPPGINSRLSSERPQVDAKRGGGSFASRLFGW